MVDPWMTPGENASMAEIEQADRIKSQALDDWQRGDLSGEFAEKLMVYADEFAEEATDVDGWSNVRRRVSSAAPKLYDKLMDAVIADRIEKLYEEAR